MRVVTFHEINKMIMKTKKYRIINYITTFAILTALVGSVFYSCKKEDDDPMPAVTNFRVVEKDSSIMSGAFGLYIAIQGTNLQNVQEVWFNDLKATLNPNFITSTNIVCAIPNKLPGEILNKVKLVTGGGQVYTTDFKVELPRPVIKGLYNEMAAPGSQTKVVGDYLYFIKSVKFGDKVAEILASTEHAITIKIPADAVPGSLVTVEAEGGTVTSTFKYNDPGLWLFDFDKNATTWGSVSCWGGMKMRKDAESYHEQYGYVVGTELPASGWNNDWVTSTCWFDYNYKDLNYSEKVLKFEVNAKEAWLWNGSLKPDEHAALLININGVATHTFRPQEWPEYKASGFTTDGWMTVTVPMNGLTFANITDFQLVFKTNKQTYEKFATYFDNFRICDIVNPN